MKYSNTLIFRYLFVDFWTTKYTLIFVRKFFKTQIYLNIFSEPYFKVSLLIFNEKSIFRYSLCITNIQCKILFKGSMNEPFKKSFFNHWWVQIFDYSRKMTLEYYSYSDSCYFQSTNIFGYLFRKYFAFEYIRIFVRYIFGIQIYSDICSRPFYEIRSPLHYAEVGDIQQGLELPGKASLWAKNAFSSTGLKIWSLVCTRFSKTNMLSVQKLEPKFGHNSKTKRVPAYSNLV